MFLIDQGGKSKCENMRKNVKGEEEMGHNGNGGGRGAERP